MPSQDMIRARAYELYEGDGGDQPEQDWLRAERELRSVAVAGFGREQPRFRSESLPGALACTLQAR